jgi:nicotinate-nucleotide adenylyltransferase
MRIGILGGTFDPIHKGHLGIATQALDSFSLDSILLIPAGNPWLKSGQLISEPVHRLAMVNLVVKENPRLVISEIEINRPGPSYTVDTLEELHEMYRTNFNPYLILGIDAFYDIPLWHNPDKVFELAEMIVVSRPGVDSQPLKETYGAGLMHTQSFPSSRLEKRTISRIRSSTPNFLESPNFDISGTEIRRRVAKGCSIEGWVSDNVRHYIENNGLYQKEGFL